MMNSIERWEDGCRESEALRHRGLDVPELREMHLAGDDGVRLLRHRLQDIAFPAFRVDSMLKSLDQEQDHDSDDVVMMD